jgi:hypothetical protein
MYRMSMLSAGPTRKMGPGFNFTYKFARGVAFSRAEQILAPGVADRSRTPKVAAAAAGDARSSKGLVLTPGLILLR